jgi:hypothetical protein
MGIWPLPECSPSSARELLHAHTRPTNENRIIITTKARTN